MEWIYGAGFWSVCHGPKSAVFCLLCAVNSDSVTTLQLVACRPTVVLDLKRRPRPTDKVVLCICVAAVDVTKGVT